MKLYNKLKNQQWFNLALSLCIAVLFFFVLLKVPFIWNLIKTILKIASPLILGLVIAYIVDPLVRLFQRSLFRKLKKKNLGRTLSIILSFILIILFLVVLMWLLVPQLLTSIQGLILNMKDYILGFKDWLSGLAGGMFSSYVDNLNFEDFSEGIVELLSKINPGEKIISASFSVGTGLVNLVISTILALYFLFDKKNLLKVANKTSKALLKEKKYNTFVSFCSNSNKILVKYVCCSLLEALAVGVLNAIFMLICGMPYVAVISVAVGVTNLAPTFGPIVGAVFGGFILLMINPLYMVLFVAFTIVLQMCDGYVLKPKLFSGTLGVSPILILVSIIVLGKIFGIIGVLLSIPIAAILQYVFKEYLEYRRKKQQKNAESEPDNAEETPEDAEK